LFNGWGVEEVLHTITTKVSGPSGCKCRHIQSL